MDVSGSSVNKRVRKYMDKGLTYEEAMKLVFAKTNKKPITHKKTGRIVSKLKRLRRHGTSILTGKPGHSVAGRIHLRRKKMRGK